MGVSVIIDTAFGLFLDHRRGILISSGLVLEERRDGSLEILLHFFLPRRQLTLGCHFLDVRAGILRAASPWSVG